MTPIQPTTGRRQKTLKALGADEQRFRLSGIPWPSYVNYADQLGERHVRVTYEEGELEFRTVSFEHERAKSFLADLLLILMLEMGIDSVRGGSMTFRRVDLERGLEPDECYWIAHEASMRRRERFDALVDPPPDLVLEIEISRSSLNRMRIYSRLRVPEVWRFDGTTLSFAVLSRKGRYEPRRHSKAFPFLQAADLQRFVDMTAAQGSVAVQRAFRDWVREYAAEHGKKEVPPT